MLMEACDVTIAFALYQSSYTLSDHFIRFTCIPVCKCKYLNTIVLAVQTIVH